MLFMLLTGNPPFEGNSDNEIIKNVKAGVVSYTDPIWRKRSNESQDLVKKMLSYNPENRISARDALKHPFLSKQVIEKIDDITIDAALTNLNRFRTGQKLQQAALTFMVNQMLTKKDEVQLQATFKAVDTDQNGLISKDELVQAYLKQYEGKKNVEDIVAEATQLFNAADADASGEIDYSEWAMATVNKQDLLTDEKLQYAFELFDVDKTG